MRFELDGHGLAILSLPVAQPSMPATLSPAEREVVRGVLRGLSNKDIADLRGTSTRTVANQLQAVFRKLDVRSRSELLARVYAPVEDDTAVEAV